MIQRFFAVPMAEEAEAPTSWLTRAAASQGESLKGFAEVLGLEGKVGHERNFVASAPRHIAQACGLPSHAFDFAFRLLDLAYGLEAVHPLLLTHRGKERFRFCPLCLKQQRTPFLPVHWRFEVWRMCYQHKCMMEDACPHCEGPVISPPCMMRPTSRRCSNTFVSQCQHCFKLLWNVSPVYVDYVDEKVISMQDRVKLANGNAFLSALAHEVAVFPGIAPINVRQGLTLAKRCKLLPEGSHLTAAVARERTRNLGRVQGLKRDRAKAIAEWFDARALAEHSTPSSPET